METAMTAQYEGPPEDERRLVQEALTNVDAFAELYRRHLRSIFRYHVAHTGNVRDAEDLTSQTFMAALEGIRSFRGESPFGAWLMGIASRKRALFFRGRKDPLPLEAAFQTPSHHLPTDQAADQNIQIAAISHALRQITPQRAEAIILCSFGGLTYREASHLLNTSEAAVKMLVSRGLRDLRERTSLALEAEP